MFIPTAAIAVAWVVIVGLALTTVKVSPGSPQRVLDGALLVSPP
jgi:hypothetical protein